MRFQTILLLMKLPLLLALTLLSGCGIAKWDVTPEIEIGKSYKIGDVYKVPVGSTMLRVEKLHLKPAFTPVFEYQPPYAGLNEVSKLKPGQMWIAMYQTQNGFILVNPEYSPAIGINIKSNGAVKNGWINISNSTVMMQSTWGKELLFKKTKSVSDKVGFAVELIYSGMIYNTVRIAYREFVDDMARPAFSQELTYNLDKSRSIVFRTIELEIIEATNSYLSFKILDDGNLPWMPGQKQELYQDTMQPTDNTAKTTTTSMILIPAGDFQMGVDGLSSYPGERNAMPRHTVYLDAFYMDRYEVTNALYKKFMDATGHRAPAYWNHSRYNAPDQPVVGVSWYDAKTYAEWAGKRLPTEAEWEKAARGGLNLKKYPWGDRLTHTNANSNGTGHRDRWKYTAPVGSFPPNSYGLYDMAGNVWEWCADWSSKEYYSNSPKQNPAGPKSGKDRILRGGSWNDATEYYLGCAIRNEYDPNKTERSIGFRCAK